MAQLTDNQGTGLLQNSQQQQQTSEQNVATPNSSIVSIPDSILHPKLWKCTFEHRAERKGELTIQPGDVINVTNTSNMDWYVGFLPDGTSGTFPSNCCSPILPDFESSRTSRSSNDSTGSHNSIELSEVEKYSRVLLCIENCSRLSIVLSRLILLQMTASFHYKREKT